MNENERPIKVLCCLLDNRFGGPHRLALAAARWMRQHAIETVFLLGRKSDQTWQPEGFPVFTLKHIQCYKRKYPVVNMLRFWLLLPFNLWRIRRIIRSNDITMVHVDGITNFVPALAAGLTRIPIVWLYNDHLPPVFERLLLGLVTRLASVVLVQGEALKEQRTGAHAKLHAKTEVLYSCVDTAQFDPDRYDPARKEQIKRDLGLPPDGAVVGIIANLNRLKGHAYFIKAAAKIHKQVKSVKFLVVGRKLGTDPGYWEQLQQLTAENGLQNDIIYAGFQSDIPAVMAVMDVFVLASVLESCPVVVLEAMAMKVPVVATDVGAVAEMVEAGQSGTVVPVADPDAIAGAVVEYLTGAPERLSATKKAARERVQALFAEDRIAARQEDLYEQVCRHRAGRAATARSRGRK